jgi:hypothetical protein
VLFTRDRLCQRQQSAPLFAVTKPAISPTHSQHFQTLFALPKVLTFT